MASLATFPTFQSKLKIELCQRRQGECSSSGSHPHANRDDADNLLQKPINPACYSAWDTIQRRGWGRPAGAEAQLVKGESASKKNVSLNSQVLTDWSEIGRFLTPSRYRLSDFFQSRGELEKRRTSRSWKREKKTRPTGCASENGFSFQTGTFLLEGC
ncbi:hypothetical protein NPIL_416631 [Nephila pilipes]|uniref:Uncharacterized protein n=1 Tax=Nephila pilipes TaxID=299642 RepID=A0A8X6P1H8_NEPPI|nr:hypothetical protein NPIL_416631 [Nephila pilipes]